MAKVCAFLVLLLATGVMFTTHLGAAEVKNLTVAIGIDADTLNPQEGTTLLFDNMCSIIYDTLFWQRPDGSLEPRLATKYEISEDGLIWTLHLRKGVKFSDGTPYNAKAQKLTFDRALDPKMRVPLRFTVSMIQEVTVVDDYTLKLHLKYPYAPLATTLSTQVVSPISPAAIEKYGEDVRTNPVGAGSFVLKERVKGERIVLARNENYYGRKPTVEKISFLIIPEESTRTAMLQSGQVDMVYKPSPANVKALQADPNITVTMPESTRIVFIGLNGKKGVTKNKLVRQAFNYAVDKKAICEKLLFGAGVPLTSPMSSNTLYYRKMDKQYEYNPKKAIELLKQANFDFSQTINMRTCHGRYLFDKQISEAIQAYLQDIGVKVSLRTYDWPTYVAGLLKPLDQTELEIFILGWASWTMDPDIVLYGQFHSSNNPPNGLGAAFYENPDFDKAVEATRREQDTVKRTDLLKAAAEIVWDDCPWIWLHSEKFIMARKSNIKGLVVTATEKFWPEYCTIE